MIETLDAACGDSKMRVTSEPDIHAGMVSIESSSKVESAAKPWEDNRDQSFDVISSTLRKGINPSNLKNQ